MAVCLFMPCEGQDDAEEVLPVPQGMSLPLKTDSEVQSFDAALAQDAGLRKALVTVIVFSNFYRAMHFSAKHGIAIAFRLSVCPSLRDVGEL